MQSDNLLSESSNIRQIEFRNKFRCIHLLLRPLELLLCFINRVKEKVYITWRKKKLCLITGQKTIRALLIGMIHSNYSNSAYNKVHLQHSYCSYFSFSLVFRSLKYRFFFLRSLRFSAKSHLHLFSFKIVINFDISRF